MEVLQYSYVSNYAIIGNCTQCSRVHKTKSYTPQSASPLGPGGRVVQVQSDYVPANTVVEQKSEDYHLNCYSVGQCHTIGMSAVCSAMAAASHPVELLHVHVHVLRHTMHELVFLLTLQFSVLQKLGTVTR